MKKLACTVLFIALAGCASQHKTDSQIYQEANAFYVTQLPAGQNSVSLPSVKIPSHGLLADNLAIAAGGDANVTPLRNALSAARAAGDKGFLIIGSQNGALDVAVIRNAVDSQDLSGMTILYSGDLGKSDAIRSAVEKANGEFQFIR
ncbi:hypothetical protein FB481_10785 [Pseudomonas sp. AG1028]|uniref:hypothetical protein n=1 Tax=Pseudomonas sp. AG1028 TaxID=2572911 RepID=UPI0011ABC694|nr:hypothetical protein [Pseudomonas sp. AG1028]TWE05338.1 hypothetical protein FB481_10785 [Pseudomonas sp. AG1028]